MLVLVLTAGTRPDRPPLPDALPSDRRRQADVGCSDAGRSPYHHRALLFKVLADQVQLPSALIRGEYNRAYNVVYVPVGTAGAGADDELVAAEEHVVDVTHSPGHLQKIQNTAELHLSTNFFENFASRGLVKYAAP